MKSGFALVAAADLGAMHPMSDLAEVEATLDEIAARSSGPASSEVPELVASLNPKAIWDKYNKRAKR